MSMNVNVVIAIVKKDIHGLLPLILLGLAVFVAEPLIAKLSLDQEAEIWSVLQTAFYWLAYFVATLLMISVIQLDPATSLNHDWLSRPIARLDWLLAKLAFVFLTICVPIASARFIVGIGNDYGIAESFADAMAIQFPPALLATPILLAIALLTPTLRKTILVLVVICMIFVVPAWDGGRRLLNRIGIDISNEFGGTMWLQALPILALGLASALLVYWLLYCRRRLARAWIAFGVNFFFVFLCLFPPASLYGWNEVIGIHRWMINEADDSIEDAVVLEHALACFPAAPLHGDAATNPILIQAAWERPIIDAADPRTLTFATTVTSRDTLQQWFAPSDVEANVPVDWRVDRIRVRSRFTAESLPQDIELLRSSTALDKFADLSVVSTDYWLIPGAAVDSLAGDPSTRLILDYDLALLSPTPYELKTDGQPRELPELGTCRAEVNGSANRIEVECVKHGPRPALVSAELIGVPGSRDDNFYKPAYTPDWLESIGGQRYELRLGSLGLVDSSAVMLTAYKVERILHKRLETRGVLGESPSNCPLPSSEAHAAIERSS